MDFALFDRYAVLRFEKFQSRYDGILAVYVHPAQFQKEQSIGMIRGTTVVKLFNIIQCEEFPKGYPSDSRIAFF